MHSRIFELKTNKEDDNELSEHDFEEGYLSTKFDYVVELDKEGDYNDSMQWLQNSYGNSIKVDIAQKTIQFLDPSKLVSKSFEKFKEALDTLSCMDINDFINVNHEPANIDHDICYVMWQLKDAYSSDCEFFIYHDNELKSVNDFIRDYNRFLRDHHGDITKRVFHFGTILDYHI